MKFILISDAVRLTGLDRQTIKNWMDKGIIPYQKINGTFYVDEDTFVSLNAKMHDIKGTEQRLEAYRAECETEIGDYRKAQELARTERNINRYLSICINTAVRTAFFGNMLDLMVKNGDLKEKEAMILTELLNGYTYEEVKERYNTSREYVRKLAERAIRKSRNLVNIKRKLESVKSLQDEIDGLRRDIQVLKRHIGKQSLAEDEVNLSEDEKRLVRMDSVELNAILSKSIVNEDLSVRAINNLYCYKDKRGMCSIKTLGDLCRITRLDYMAQRNAGKKTADEIEALLKAYGLNWGIDVEKVLRIRI